MNYKFGVYGDSIAFGYGNNNQSWFDEDKWAFNSDIELFNQKLQQLCSELNVHYLDAYSEFCAKNLAELYIDAVHLNKQGQSELAMVYSR